jgi:carbon monoxide dehydrogenase subunit G
MRFEGHFDVAAEPRAVYDFLTDPRRVTRCMPDVEDVQVHDGDHFTVRAKVGVSHIRGVMVMKLSIADRHPPVSTKVIGQGTGLSSVVDVVTSFTLEPAGGRTVIIWYGDVKVAGKLAAFGSHGLLDRMGQKNVERFIDGIKGGIEEMTGGAPRPPGRPSFFVRILAWLRQLFARGR